MNKKIKVQFGINCFESVLKYLKAQVKRTCSVKQIDFNIFQKQLELPQKELTPKEKEIMEAYIELSKIKKEQNKESNDEAFLNQNLVKKKRLIDDNGFITIKSRRLKSHEVMFLIDNGIKRKASSYYFLAKLLFERIIDENTNKAFFYLQEILFSKSPQQDNIFIFYIRDKDYFKQRALQMIGENTFLIQAEQKFFKTYYNKIFDLKKQLYKYILIKTKDGKIEKIYYK